MPQGLKPALIFAAVFGTTKDHPNKQKPLVGDPDQVVPCYKAGTQMDFVSAKAGHINPVSGTKKTFRG
jgi:hypothetical protein